MNVKLVMAKGGPREHVIELSSPETIIGRHRDCHLRIPSSDVSRRHCVLKYQNGYLSVEDLGSTNGTFVNGAKVTSRLIVKPGDELEVGPVAFAVEYQISKTPEADMPIAADIDVLEVDENQEAVVVMEEEDDTFNFKPAPSVPQPPAEPAAQAAEEVVDVEFDIDAEPLNLPNDNNLRDILSRLDG